MVGDDVYEEDITIKAFEREFANVMGKEEALFVPTGTMGNLIGSMRNKILIECRRLVMY